MTWGDPCIVESDLDPDEFIFFSAWDRRNEIRNILLEGLDTEKTISKLIEWMPEAVSGSIKEAKDEMAELLKNNLDGRILLSVIHDLVSERATKKEVANWLLDHNLAASDTPHPALMAS